MSFGREPHPDELISASLSGDLAPDERATLDAHLATCEQCRTTLNAFSRERQMVGGLRRSAPPADLGARIRTAVESGAGATPWWRRPSTLVGAVATLGTVAAALLAVVVLGSIPRGPVGATGSPEPSASMVASVIPSASVPEPSQSPSATTRSTASPVASINPNPVGMLEYRLQDQQGSISVTTDVGSQPVAVERLGIPIDASLAPGGEWVAFQLKGDGSGMVDTYAYRISDGTLVTLFTGAADSPFSRLVWSANGGLLAFTGISGDAQEADAWVFNVQHPEAGARRLTSTGRTFAADFYGAADGDVWLWVSSAADGEPSTDRLPVPSEDTLQAPLDVAADSLKHIDGTFLPLWDRNPSQPGYTVAWQGQMALDAGGWHFARGGMPYAYAASLEGEYDLQGSDLPIFDTLTPAPGGQAFRSARFAWAPDADGFAVWDAQWEGTQQPAGFPDATRVYFGHPLDGVFIGPTQALDAADTAGGTVIDVALAGGQYLALTVQTAAGSEGGAYGPTAEVRVITRNTGDTPDDVSTVAEGGAWIGPAFYDHGLRPS
jgi:hypothetical protein